MPTHYKTAGEAFMAASEMVYSTAPGPTHAESWENAAQTFLRSEWGESETLCSECGQRGTHRAEDCPFPKTPLLFAEMENTQPQPTHAE